MSERRNSGPNQDQAPKKVSTRANPFLTGLIGPAIWAIEPWAINAPSPHLPTDLAGYAGAYAAATALFAVVNLFID